MGSCCCNRRESEREREREREEESVENCWLERVKRVCTNCLRAECVRVCEKGYSLLFERMEGERERESVSI